MVRMQNTLHDNLVSDPWLRRSRRELRFLHLVARAIGEFIMPSHKGDICWLLPGCWRAKTSRYDEMVSRSSSLVMLYYLIFWFIVAGKLNSLY